jgi:hypothetical protein
MIVRSKKVMENLNKSRIVRILRIIMPIVGIIGAIVIAPWDLVPLWIAPLPDTVQEQVDDAVDQGLAETILEQIDCSLLAIKPPGFVTPVTLKG